MRKFAFWLSFLCGSLAMPQGAPIRARVYDYTPVPEKVLERAELHATQLLQSCAVPLEWLDCNRQEAACMGELRRNDVAFLLQSKAITKTHAAGAALVEQSHAAVYARINYTQILDIARAKQAPSDALLGYVMAHELGHLLGLPHSWRGLMAAHWGAGELSFIAMGRTGFDYDECRQMRAETRIRLSLTTSY